MRRSGDLGTLNGNNEPVLGGVNLNMRAIKPIDWDSLEIPDLPGAACKGVDDDEAFFPKRPGMPSTERAKAICRSCPVKDACLTDVLAWESREDEKSYGVWGGLDEWERKKLRDHSVVKLCGRNIHEMTGDNLMTHAKGVRCRACYRAASAKSERERRSRRKGKS